MGTCLNCHNFQAWPRMSVCATGNRKYARERPNTNLPSRVQTTVYKRVVYLLVLCALTFFFCFRFRTRIIVKWACDIIL